VNFLVVVLAVRLIGRLAVGLQCLVGSRRPSARDRLQEAGQQKKSFFPLNYVMINLAM
jgi:hypothetical protein